MQQPIRLTDRERILTVIIRELATSQLLAHHGLDHYNGDAYRSANHGELAHFDYKSEPAKGDLVLAKTGGVHEWSIGWFVEKLPSSMGGAVIAEIGSHRLCNYGNESFVTIRGIRKTDLLESDEYVFYCKAIRAFQRGDEYIYRFGGVDFKENRNATIWVREVFGGLVNIDTEESVPFQVEIKWNRKTSVKSILRTMREAGYGTRKFEHRAKTLLCNQNQK